MTRGHKKYETSTIKSARRVLEVFELFSRLKQPASVSDVQNHLKYPQSSTSVLLKSLHALGYLDYDPIKRRYMPTMRVNLLGAWMQAERLGGVNIDELLRRLRRETGETVVLGMQNGIYVQYIHLLHSPAPLRLHIDSGILRPLCRSAAGKMLMTLKPAAEIRGIIRRINATDTDANERIDVEDFLQHIERCRRQGYAVNLETAMVGIGAVAMLLPVSSSLPPMAISVVGLAQQIGLRWQHIVKIMTGVLEEFTSHAEEPTDSGAIPAHRRPEATQPLVDKQKFRLIQST
jgi:DNA-binding IclR family transcriptional regulator